MKVPDYMISGLQGPAMEACFRLGINPHDVQPDGEQNWVKMAAEMVKLRTMAECLRNFGMAL